jgi:hypothetical protein
MAFLTPKTTLGAALAAIALGGTAISAQSGGANDLPITCSVDVSSRGGMLTIEGVLAAQANVSGTYHLHVSGRGAELNQGGPFSVRAGATERLGRVTINGPASGLDAELTLDVGGKTARCPVNL